MKLYGLLMTMLALYAGASLYVFTMGSFNDDFSCFDGATQTKFVVQNYRSTVKDCYVCSNLACQKPKLEECEGIYYFVKLQSLIGMCTQLAVEASKEAN